MNDFELYRTLLFSIAYRMLGSVMEAEDIVQEAFLRYQAVAPQQIESPKAYLMTIVTRLCLDQLKSARQQRETYIGPWLPEPIIAGDNAFGIEPATAMNQLESISMAFLVLLEALSPLERAIFLLREVFDYDYPEIASMVGKSEGACRQLFSRAKKHIADNRPRYQTTQEEHNRLLVSFMQAIEVGELSPLLGLLAEDVTSWSDGGGRVQAATRPVHGRDAVARLLLGLRRFATDDMQGHIMMLNGASAIVIRNRANQVILVITLETGDGLIRAVRLINNPDKLKHLD